MTPILFFIASMCIPGPQGEPICQDAVRPFACLEVPMDDGSLALGCAWYDERVDSLSAPSRETYSGAAFYAADWPTVILAADRGDPITPSGGAINCMPLRDTLFCEAALGR
jgi:hypothetical protein